MSQSQRLFEILQILRRHRQAVSGNYLAQETGVSLRTIYRDISLLQSIGAEIEGEPGFGYVLKPGFILPPLMFSEAEIKAITLGVQWVTHQTDEDLRAAAQDALAKIEAVLPSELRHGLTDNDFHIGLPSLPAPAISLKVLRQAMQQQMKLRIVYRDARDTDSNRIIFWMFRADRILEAALLADRYPGKRRELVKQWRAQAQEACDAVAQETS
ncbi:helix-turn-helix transcriptional regulator [Rhizobium leguminosarum]|uniref:helix-turn-helix transcriptional regulator n=1 Tax=Rhizobium leguminosarum TaxID=384 RepID=UPI003F964313